MGNYRMNGCLVGLKSGRVVKENEIGMNVDKGALPSVCVWQNFFLEENFSFWFDDKIGLWKKII
jgi:hypothetical protein